MPAPGLSSPQLPGDENQNLEFVKWPVGMWPEDIAFDGKDIWVAESGQETLVQLNADSGEVIRRVDAGPMTVGMVSNISKGTIFAADASDRTLLKYSNSGTGSVFASVPGFYVDIIADEVAIWVLTDNGKVIRYDQDSGATTTAKLNDRNYKGDYWSLTRSGNSIFVIDIDRDLSVIVELDKDDLFIGTEIEIDGFFPSIAANDSSIFVAGGEPDVDGEIIQFKPGTAEIISSYNIENEYVELVTADSNFVVAVGEYGTLWLFSAKDLKFLKSVSLIKEDWLPGSVLIQGESVYITTHVGNGENGSILVLRDFLRGQIR
tara:strand:+ start:370 stop:1326 length:957 start_codon:yes stop_codon:yes gene_type:complete